MSEQRARPAVAPEHSSAHPNIAGIPWWGAILTAVIASAIGFAFDAGSGGGQLTAAFAALYVVGCLVAVLAVQQSNLFTAVIQPPLVLFVTVPAAYFLMHSSDIQGLKDILINCGYPLIERFPLMFFTSAAVLMIGLARWYFAKSGHQSGTQDRGRRAPAGAGLSAKLSSLLGGSAADGDAAADEPPRRRATDRRRTAPKPAARKPSRGDRPVKRSAPRARHAPAPETEIIEPVADRPRRRRPRPEEQPPTPEPRRRPRTSSAREPRDARSRDPLPPRERRSPYDGDDRYDHRPARDRGPREQPRRRSRFDDHEPFDPYSSAGTSSHHPISRVRYRGADDVDDRAEPRSRRRSPRDADADRWEFDI
ncbi:MULTISPECIES: DUF6542 domain-containing protein [Mycolicibacterium]|uniref:DUF6542 domain-containing protein n=2 Tax=Mycolicibacterium TaxID=1866885 RepID=A0ABT8HMT0_MYCAO|nr:MULTISPECIES: DUF6542 domain-containing protein [Mycolicibacterium]MDN4522068.1 hypothetical protein [Mycolicibacterium austroafricanum]QRZ05667.1 hypothetical protein JN090_22470 [Mycolicibacterium austroafricanum]QZT67223.1 hypothetical protein JN086_22370 [Mycolicibacterium austroafricanum]QZY44986.1 hypothetical protein K5L12_22595 [Mycolicibacterium austroafricanum]UJL28743.1 hypothetical protein HZU38_28795 [Mycolicibacterium vanbaalenii]